MSDPRRVACGLLAGLLLLAASAGPLLAQQGEDAAEGAQRAHNLKVFGLSLLLPGLAHVADGQVGRAAPFLIAEAGFWTAFATFRIQGGLRRDTYVDMVGIHAGVQRPKGQSEDYYRLIGSWSSSDAYDETVRREARAIYGDDLQGREAYFEANKVSADEAWNWDSAASMKSYRDKRRSSQQAYRGARTVVALAVANRVAAILDYALLAHHRGPGGSALHLTMMPGPEISSARLALRCDLP